MKALYRKYRPLKLADVVGQPQVVDILKNAIKTGKFSHAYLFTGPRGCGKTSAARIFAHEINHFDYQLEDSYLDILEIDGASNRGIDNIRELREKAAIAPSEGKYKIYIIDEVHMLTKEAFNALLKTLEEPPAHVIFLMATTDLDRVPVTILSRSQVLHFKLADDQIMFNHLQKIARAEKIAISDDALKLLVRRGGGSFRDTISLLDQISTMFAPAAISAANVISALGLPRDDSLEAILKSYDAQDFTTLTKTLENELNTGTSAILIASELIDYLLKHPNPARLPLLKTLTTVDGAYPEAKLLLAFSGAFETTFQTFPKITPAPVEPPKSPLAPPKSQPADLPPSTPKTPENAPEAPKTATSLDSAPQKSPETPANAASATPEATSSEHLQNASVAAQITSDAFLSAISSASPSLGDILRKSHLEISGNTIKISPEKKIYKSILKSKNNADLLKKHLPAGFSLEIADFDPNSLKKDPTFSQISDIMGNIQELSTGQTDPF